MLDRPILRLVCFVDEAFDERLWFIPLGNCQLLECPLGADGTRVDAYSMKLNGFRANNIKGLCCVRPTRHGPKVLTTHDDLR